MNGLNDEGRIPAGTECPYKADCGDYAQTSCMHQGVDHDVDFSCAFARAFEILADRKCK